MFQTRPMVGSYGDTNNDRGHDRYDSPFKSFPPDRTDLSMTTNTKNPSTVQQRAPYPVSECNIPMETTNEPIIRPSGSNDSNEEKKSRHGRRDISDYSPRGQAFYKVYEETVNDVKIFTPEIQMRWCEMLLSVSQDHDFISHYTINAEKLKRELNSVELLRNQKIIIEHAFKVLTKLIKLKWPNAYFLMGCLYSHRVTHFDLINYDFINQNDKKALTYYCEAAKLGHSESSYRAGICYEFNKGVDEMSSKERMEHAIYYYKLGAIQYRHYDCMFKLGMYYINGTIPAEGNEPCTTGIKWLEKACNEGHSTQACYELGKIYEFDTLNDLLQIRLNKESIDRDHIKSLQYYYQCANEYDYPLAQRRLGTCYEFGEMGLPINCKKSIGWYMKASTPSTTTKKRNVNPVAMLSLAGWFFTGSTDIMSPDYTLSFEWIQRSCTTSQGKLARAEYILGYYYHNGIGTAINLPMATLHMSNAAKLGHSKSIEWIAQFSK